MPSSRLADCQLFACGGSIGPEPAFFSSSPLYRYFIATSSPLQRLCARCALTQHAEQQFCCHDHNGRQDQAAVAGGSGRRPVEGFVLDKKAMGLPACHGGELA
tara:strand:- start:1425 stop:1733 length:309 start_codon:yes stop_codon:yes gene_type:complete